MESLIIYPEYKITIGDYVLTQGIEFECFTSQEAHDWCKVKMKPEYKSILSIRNMDKAKIELGYDGIHYTVLEGYISTNITDNTWEGGLVIKDELIKCNKAYITATYIDATPQDIIANCLNTIGINNIKLSDKPYKKYKTIPIVKKNIIDVLTEINMLWGIQEKYFFRNGVFYWGTVPEQKEIFTLEQGKNILSMSKVSNQWEIETVAMPYIKHSEQIKVEHFRYNKEATVKKMIYKGDEKGFIRTYIYI